MDSFDACFIATTSFNSMHPAAKYMHDLPQNNVHANVNMNNESKSRQV